MLHEEHQQEESKEEEQTPWKSEHRGTMGQVVSPKIPSELEAVFHATSAHARSSITFRYLP